MTHVTCVDVASRDRLRWVDAGAVGALEGTRARARNVEDSNVAVGSAHEAVIQVACVKCESRNRARRVEAIGRCGKGALAGACAGARGIERFDGAVLIPQEAMIHIAVVIVVSRDLPCRIDVIGEGALAKTRARARRIERGQGAVGSAQEAVDVAADTVVTRDRARGVDAVSIGVRRARPIERGEGAAGSAHEAVTHVARVMDDARDFSRRVNAKGEGALEGARARARSIERREARIPLVSICGKAQPQHGQG